MLLKKVFRFEASHILPKHPGKCSRLHGHSWVLHVAVVGKINPATGFVMDYAEISKAVKPLVDDLDHRHLGQWVSEANQSGIPTDTRFVEGAIGTSHKVPGLSPDFYPSSENLLLWIAEQLDKNLAWSHLALEETCTSYCELTRSEWEIVKVEREDAKV
jgi:6-pyruvoyltetrahydropterin/6-carboxytetrahydropterin synthase